MYVSTLCHKMFGGLRSPVYRSVAVVIAVWLALPASSAGQRVTQPYSSYYGEQLRQYHRPPTDPSFYTYDRYFYHRPTVSPYLNLVRPAPQGSTCYHAYVVPETRRRLSSTPPQRLRVSTVPRRMSNRSSRQWHSSYGHWYNQSFRQGRR